MKKIIFVLFLILVPLMASAHQPRIVDTTNTVIENPEISQAFYGNLNGGPDYYNISSKDPFLLYANILVPDLPNIDKDVFVEVYDSTDNIVWSSLSSSVSWEAFFEEFAGDSYFKGPEFEKNVEAGDYRIKVSSQDNIGKYVLAVGKIESFPLGESLKTLTILPTLKTQFFEKSIWLSFYNTVGLFLLVALIILIVLIFLIIFIIKKIKNRRIWPII